MDDVKDKMKGFMKKFNNSLSPSSSSGKFKGQGRVLGSSSSSTPAGQVDSNLNRPTTHVHDPKHVPSQRPSSSTSNVSPKNPTVSEQPAKSTNEFDPFDALITTGKRNKNGYDLKVFECPICSQAFGSEEAVSEHVESCLSNESNPQSTTDDTQEKGETRSQLESCVGTYVSGKPLDGSVGIVLKLLKNIVRDPENVKFRKIRLGNPKIKEAIADVSGGLDLLECVGFELKEESGEMWAVMEAASSEKIKLIKDAVYLLELPKIENVSSTDVQAKVVEPEEVKKIERQTRVFFSVSESVAAKIELPDSFYNLSINEVKREAETRRKKLEESQLLVPKSYKEKQAKAARKRHEKTIIRVQFPDGVVLQAFFNPREPTTALYEFVSSLLKDPSLEFELLHPVVIKRRVIPNFGEKTITLEEEELVPSALIKFRPKEIDSVVFTGLCNELLQNMEPLVSESAVAP